MTEIEMSAHIPAPGANAVPVSVTVQTTLATPVTGDTVTLTGPAGAVVAGTVIGAGTLRNFTPSAPLAYSTAYTVTVAGGQDDAGNVMSPASWSFTTAPEPTPGVSFYGDDAFMGGAYDDGVDYSLGARLSFSAVQAVTHIRWWVPADGEVPAAAAIYGDNNDTPVSMGDLAGVVAPTGGGWVSIPLEAELVPEPHRSYVATVLITTPLRRYPALLEAFAAGPVTRHGITYETGVFAVGSTLARPTQVYHSASYGVDVFVRPVPAGAPTGEAGAQQTAVFGETVTLHGTGSDDGTITSWTWRQISGPAVTLASIGPSRTFTAPTVPGLLVFGLTVTDDDGNTSVEDETVVAVHHNPTAAENLLPGMPKSVWDVVGVGDPSVLGYGWPYSLNAGQTVQFRVDGPATSIDVYRLGFYHGQGARLHASVINVPVEQPQPVRIPGSNGGVECTNWTATATWSVPTKTISGQFIAVVNGPGDARSHIPFVVRNDDRRADVVHKSADTTWHAYNYFGDTTAQWNQGACLYGRGNAWATDTDRAYAVSWARPIVHRQDRPQTFLFNAEYPAIRFLEEVGVDVQYIGCQDLDRSADCLLHRKVFISSGHDEYWSQAMRDHASQARDAGVSLIFWSANEVFWRTRWDAAADPERRVMWCYKDTMNGPTEGPDAAPTHEGGQQLDPVTWTGTFRDPRRPGGAVGEWRLTGTEFRMNGVTDRDVMIRAATYSSAPYWRNTCVATGQDISLVGTLGFEADEVNPATDNVVLLGDTEAALNGNRADDAGQTYNDTGILHWGIVLQGYPSGATVAGFGTVQWAWSLSTIHDRQGSVPSQAARQATLNLLSDMGAPPATVPLDLIKPNPVGLDSYGISLA